MKFGVFELYVLDEGSVSTIAFSTIFYWANIISCDFHSGPTMSLFLDFLVRSIDLYIRKTNIDVDELALKMIFFLLYLVELNLG